MSFKEIIGMSKKKLSCIASCGKIDQNLSALLKKTGVRLNSSGLVENTDRFRVRTPDVTKDVKSENLKRANEPVGERNFPSAVGLVKLGDEEARTVTAYFETF